ncbi:MAG: ferredoxin--NADP reductase [Proteobacteria bacterium]|nr:ferredoxin--NADP reductase [Pseudomonadota bacterium]
MATYLPARVTRVRHWSDKLFSFSTTREPSLRYENGQFLMVALDVDGRRVARAYSIASANHADELEFYSIKIPGGPLTSRLQAIRAGDTVLLSAKPTGTLVLRDLRPGRRLFLLATGTGFAPFASLIRDPEIYERFESIVVVRGARHVRDLAYGDAIIEQLGADEHLGELARAQLVDYPVVTREPFRHEGRITTLIDSGRLFSDLGIAPLDPVNDRVMICGGMGMLKDLRALLDGRGFRLSPGIGEPGDYVIERAFVGA